MPSYIPSSTRFGSTMIMRTSSGVALYRIDMIMRVDHDALARSGGAGDQQVRHGFERRHLDAAVDVLAQRNRQVRVRIRGTRRIPASARRLITSRRGVRHFDADGRLAGNALDQDRFGLQARGRDPRSEW